MAAAFSAQPLCQRLTPPRVLPGWRRKAWTMIIPARDQRLRDGAPQSGDRDGRTETQRAAHEGRLWITSVCDRRSVVQAVEIGDQVGTVFDLGQTVEAHRGSGCIPFGIFQKGVQRLGGPDIGCLREVARVVEPVRRGSGAAAPGMNRNGVLMRVMSSPLARLWVPAAASRARAGRVLFVR